ncbi:WAT1-related protein [Sesamum angolense]|uniref:WAT1-related protein n=1 Tax=Sesamum angolense TaxID=2727404 RepID=A0AAE1X4D0_9LAMI|nr:WAT1-related protein [Sesamum angolense]
MDAAGAKICNNLHGLKPTLIMVMVQAIFAVVNVGYKLAANDGMRLPILVGYRFTFGAAFILPIAFFVERKKRPKLTWKIGFYGFLCGLLGLERLGFNTSAGKAKVLGTVMGIGGAMLLTLYKGPELNLWNTNINLLEMTKTHHQADGPTQSHVPSHNLVLGAFLALASCVCYSLWLIIQSITVALCMERDWSNWKLGWDIRLLTVAFAVGDCRVRADVYLGCVVCADERAVVRVDLQPADACDCGHCWIIVLGREASPWNGAGGHTDRGRTIRCIMGKRQGTEEGVSADAGKSRASSGRRHAAARSGGSSHGGSKREVEAEAEVEEEREEDKRDSHASSEVLVPPCSELVGVGVRRPPRFPVNAVKILEKPSNLAASDMSTKGVCEKHRSSKLRADKEGLRRNGEEDGHSVNHGSLIISANMDGVKSDASDCYDGCSTACVQPDPRLTARCDRKCQIRCSPDHTCCMIGSSPVGFDLG